MEQNRDKILAACQYLGRPDYTRTIRLYTKKECNILDGIWTNKAGEINTPDYNINDTGYETGTCTAKIITQVDMPMNQENCTKAGGSFYLDPDISNDPLSKNPNGDCILGINYSKACTILNAPEYTTDRCKGLGISNANVAGGMRFFSKNECDAIPGNWYPSGECMLQEIGSYTYFCGFNQQLNNSTFNIGNN